MILEIEKSSAFLSVFSRFDERQKDARVTNNFLKFRPHSYGGPNSARIKDVASYGYEHYMTTNRRVIYAWIDGRGSAYKGSKMLYEIYRRIGTVEVEDTIAVTK